MKKQGNSGLLNVLLMGVMAFLIFKFFFSSKPVDNKSLEGRVDLSGQVFQAPVSQLETRPLNKEIDFIDQKIPTTDHEVFVETLLCEYTFSPNGAVLSGLDFKSHRGKDGTPLRTVYKREFEEREQGCFLLAFDEKTPYVYKLVDTKHEDGKHFVTFEAEALGWVIRKTYQMNDKDYRLKLSCSFKPKTPSAGTIRPRLFVAGPFSGSVVGDKINGVINSLDKEGINKVTATQENDYGWKLPAIFGAEDKYFLHALYSVSNEEFIERAYCKRLSNRGLFSIFESKELTEGTSVEMSFYCGPKVVADLGAVDVRLQNVLDFGWFSKLCKWLLLVLEYLFAQLGSYGWAIMLLAFLIKLAFLPISLLARRKAAVVQRFETQNAGAIQSINIRYKGDFVKRGEAISKFYSENGISQFAKMASMVPLFLQVPFLIALYRGLSSYIALYQAEFLWLADLSSKDPYYILPALLGVLTLMQQKTTPVADQRAKWMAYIPSVLIVAFMASFPAGAVLYWSMNTFLMVAEEQLMRRIFGFGRA
ncbi:YidC/Oxa1 family insertase periplasmic-domain containing protein [Candidatus Babeliales bacterium]|nr:YidC/Oxa1 family insertase periplasmic-domain containing protein [Candidatus Babeliales bacterium]